MAIPPAKEFTAICDHFSATLAGGNLVRFLRVLGLAENR
jgi:hypothetical protein